MKNSTKVSLLALTAAAALIMANCANDDSYTPPQPIELITLGESPNGIQVWGLEGTNTKNLQEAYDEVVTAGLDIVFKDRIDKIYMVAGKSVTLTNRTLNIGSSASMQEIVDGLVPVLSMQLDSSRDTVRMAKMSNPFNGNKIIQQILTVKQQNQIAAMHREMGLARA